MLVALLDGYPMSDDCLQTRILQDSRKDRGMDKQQGSSGLSKVKEFSLPLILLEPLKLY